MRPEHAMRVVMPAFGQTAQVCFEIRAESFANRH
jgi:hypothetical protein